ncbi:MAG: hypothetical protein AAGI92_11200 [Pseudomonadota bacterium]
MRFRDDTIQRFGAGRSLVVFALCGPVIALNTEGWLSVRLTVGLIWAACLGFVFSEIALLLR